MGGNGLALHENSLPVMLNLYAYIWAGVALGAGMALRCTRISCLVWMKQIGGFSFYVQ